MLDYCLVHGREFDKDCAYCNKIRSEKETKKIIWWLSPKEIVIYTIDVVGWLLVLIFCTVPIVQNYPLGNLGAIGWFYAVLLTGYILVWTPLMIMGFLALMWLIQQWTIDSTIPQTTKTRRPTSRRKRNETKR